MPIMFLALLVVMVFALVIIAVVVMGMEGTGKDKHPEIAHAMARTARHLNGEGEPPKALLALFDEASELPETEAQDVPDKLPVARSSRSVQADQQESASGVPAASGVATWTSTLAAKASSAAKASRSKLASVGKALKQASVESASASNAEPPKMTSCALPDDEEAVRPVQRAGKRQRKRSKGGRPGPLGQLPGTEESDEAQQPERLSAEALNHSISEALSGPAVADPTEDDPYGVWGVDELDPEPRDKQRVRSGR